MTHLVLLHPEVLGAERKRLLGQEADFALSFTSQAAETLQNSSSVYYTSKIL